MDYLLGEMQLLELGHLIKTVGTMGGVVAQCDPPFSFQNIPHEQGNTIFLILDGLPVPFVLRGAEERGEASTATLYFETLQDAIEPKELVGARFAIPEEELSEEEEDAAQQNLSLDGLVGCTLVDQHQALVGEILDYEQYSYNTLLVVARPSGEEVLVPIHPDLIEKFPSEDEPVLQLQIADGLWE